VPVDYDLGTARGRIEIDSSQLGRASQALRTFGLATTAAGLAAAAGFAYVVKAAADFEHSMDAVQAVSGASRSEMKLLSEQALNLSTRTVFSAGEISGAMQALAKAGIPVQDMLDGATQATINLAAAAGDELPGGVQRAAEIIANAQKTFNASASEMEHFADVLVGAAASSTLSVEDLAVSMRYAGPIAAQLGLSIDDLSTTLAILGDRGIRGSTAGTSLRGVLLSLSPTSKKARDALQDLGLITEDGTNKFFDMNGSLKPIPEVMQLLQDATKGLSEEQKIQAFNTIFQRRAMNSALIMAELGSEGFLKYAEAIGAIDASDVAAAKLDNLSGDVQILRNSIETLLIRAGQPLQNFFRDIVQGITGFVQKLNELNPNVLATIVTIVGIAGVLLTLLGVTALFGSALIHMWRTFVLLKEAVVLLGGAFKLLLVTLITNPVFLIIVAIVALAAAIWLAYQRSETFREAWDGMFEDLRPIFEAIGRFVQNFVEQLGKLWEVFREGDDVAQGAAEVIDNMFGNTGKLVEPVRNLVTALIAMKDAAVSAFDYFADHVLPTMIAVGYAIVSGIQVAIDWLINTGIPGIVSFGQAVGGVASDVAAWFNEHVMPVLTAFGELVAAVARIVVGAVNVMWPAFQAAFTVIVNIVTTAFNVIKIAVETFVNIVLIIWNNFGSLLWQAVQNVWNLIVGVIEGALQIIQGIIQVFTGLLTLNWSQVWEGIKNIVMGVVQIIVTIITGFVDAVRILIEGFIALIITVWQAGWELIKGIVEIAWELIKTAISNGIAIIQGLVESFINLLQNIWNAAWQAIVGILYSAWETMKSGTQTAISAIVGFITGFPSAAWNALSGVATTLYSRGVELIGGLLSGIIFKVGEIVGYLMALPGKMVEWIGSLGSKLYNAGVALIQGLIDGIKSKISGVQSALGGITSSLTSWKGPPSKDRVILEPVGELVLEGFIQGIKNQIGPLRRVLGDIAPDMNSRLASTMAGGRASGAAVTVNLNFPNITSGAEAEVVKATLQDSDVLSRLIHATRAGVGSR
jgi:TP901 family phage tail tape measure protein